MSCEEKDIPKLSRRAQRLRVASLMLREVITDIADPTTYRELTLLNKLAASGTFEGEDEAEAALEAEAARGRLADVGLNPEDASDMVRALHALQTVMSDDAQREADDAAARPR